VLLSPIARNFSSVLLSLIPDSRLTTVELGLLRPFADHPFVCPIRGRETDSASRAQRSVSPDNRDGRDEQSGYGGHRLTQRGNEYQVMQEKEINYEQL